MKFPIKPWGPVDMAERYTLKVINRANHDAIHLMSFGFVSQANQILEVLHSHDEIDFGDPTIKKLVHFAWQASETWPQWLQISQDANTGTEEDTEHLAPTPSLRRAEEKIMQVDGEAFAEYVTDRHVDNFRGEVRKRLHKVSASSTKDEKQEDKNRRRSTGDAKLHSDSAESRNGPWEEEDLQRLSKHAKSMPTFPRSSYSPDQVIVPGAIEAALDLGEVQVAEEILEIHLVKRFQPLDQDVLATRSEHHMAELKRNYKFRLTTCSPALDSPRAWKFLTEQCHKEGDTGSTTQYGGWLASRLGVTSEMVEKWLENTLKVLGKRLSKGRSGPYSHQSIRELCMTFNDLSLQRKQVGTTGPTFYEEDLEEEETPPKTVLQEPASEDMLKDFEDRLAQEREGRWPKGLPSQYKEFLLVTNGIYIGEDGRTNGETLCPLSDAEIRQDDDPGYPDLTLLPVDTGVNTISSIVPGPDWPEIDDNIFIGAGGDEGDHCIVPRPALEKGIDYILKGWEAADDPYAKREWQRAIRDILYVDLRGIGTVEEARSKMQDIDFVIIQAYHWAAEVICFRCFRDLLEDWIDAMWREQMEKDNNDDEDGDGDGPNDDEDSSAEEDDEKLGRQVSDGEQNDDQKPAAKRLKK